MNINLKRLLIILTLLAAIPAMTLLSGVVNNKVNPAKGDYHFPLQKVWTVSSAGDTYFANIVEISVSSSGNLYLRDLKNKEYYIFDGEGTFKRTFGTHGEGPGEVKHSGGAGVSVVDDQVIIQDSDKFLYFNTEGKFIRSVVNPGHTRPATLFLNPDEFISAPANITAVPKGKATMRYVNLKTDTEQVITNFSLSKSGVLDAGGGRRAVAIIPTITPVLVVGNLDKKLYYGMNNQYKVMITDLQGKDLGAFTLDREARPVTLKEREDFMIKVAKGLAPEDLARRMAKMLPDKETMFYNIESHNNLIYVFRSHFVAGNVQQIDIFSPDGTYLYKGMIKVEEGMSIAAGPTFAGNHIYMALENEEGDISIAKYSTRLPN